MPKALNGFLKAYSRHCNDFGPGNNPEVGSGFLRPFCRNLRGLTGSLVNWAFYGPIDPVRFRKERIILVDAAFLLMR
jgi:hypothetical protein